MKIIKSNIKSEDYMQRMGITRIPERCMISDQLTNKTLDASRNDGKKNCRH
jgi:hypothetical protein